MRNCFFFLEMHSESGICKLKQGKTERNYVCYSLTATTDSTFVSVGVCVCVCLSVCVHDNSKNNESVHLKLEHIVVCDKSSDEFDIGHCWVKVKVTA